MYEIINKKILIYNKEENNLYKINEIQLRKKKK